MYTEGTLYTSTSTILTKSPLINTNSIKKYRNNKYNNKDPPTLI